MPNVFDGPLTTAALCWCIERPDGAGVALTSHDRTIETDDMSFFPDPGVTPASFSCAMGLDPGAGEISAAMNSAAFTDRDLALGRWDHGSVSLVAIDWDEPGEQLMTLLAGEVGEVAIRGEQFAAELRGTAAKLHRPVCPTTSPECRAQFGDPHCGVDLSGRTIFAHVVDHDQGELLLDRTIGPEFVFGRLRYLRGANCGLQTVVVSVAGERVRLRDLPRANVEPSCRIELREGCDKRIATCAGRFANAVNFRGEPHLPGNDLLTRYPGA